MMYSARMLKREEFDVYFLQKIFRLPHELPANVPLSFARKNTVMSFGNKAHGLRWQKRQALSGIMHMITMIFIITSLLCPTVAFTLSKFSGCDPTKRTPCRFMGKCVDARTLSQWNPTTLLRGDQLFICRCPNVHCFAAPPEPICAEDEHGNKRTFFNNVCRRLEECDSQSHWTPVCRGACNDSNCLPFEKESNVKNCPEDQEGYCKNGGICLLFRDGPTDPFCRCPKGYIGPRCGRRYLILQEDPEVRER